jgi:isopentenyl-diphosphate delta-isomerase
MTAQVVLVDTDDREVGVEEKIRAHALGHLHRAVSVFVFNSAGELLLQRRARAKYHCGGAWSNTACGHPETGEGPVIAASRRLREEMGIECPLSSGGTFVYCLPVGAGLIENEFDHLFYGYSDDAPVPDPAEVSEWRWVHPDTLARELRTRPAEYTPWLAGALAQLKRKEPSRSGAIGHARSPSARVDTESERRSPT